MKDTVGKYWSDYEGTLALNTPTYLPNKYTDTMSALTNKSQPNIPSISNLEHILILHKP